MLFTNHGAARCQQRGIRPEILDVLLTYGRRKWRHGAEICFMDKIARAQARNDMGPKGYARVADRLNAYVVIADDGVLVTAAQRLRRLKI